MASPRIKPELRMEANIAALTAVSLSFWESLRVRVKTGDMDTSTQCEERVKIR